MYVTITGRYPRRGDNLEKGHITVNGTRVVETYNNTEFLKVRTILRDALIAAGTTPEESLA